MIGRSLALARRRQEGFEQDGTRGGGTRRPGGGVRGVSRVGLGVFKKCRQKTGVWEELVHRADPQVGACVGGRDLCS